MAANNNGKTLSLRASKRAMKVENFQDLYRDTFTRLGFPLKQTDGLPSDKIAGAEKRIGIRLPTALRDYYLVAGRERTLNHAYNRLLALDDLDLHRGKLVFMEENQWVVVWGTAASRKVVSDPAVYQGPIVEEEPSGWFLEQRKCSAFLVFMLHMQAAFGGGMPFTASASAGQGLVAKLDKDWRFGGEVNGMRTYSKQGKAICFVKWRDNLAKEKPWRVFAGASHKDALQTIALELTLRWD